MKHKIFTLIAVLLSVFALTVSAQSNSDDSLNDDCSFLQRITLNCDAPADDGSDTNPQIIDSSTDENAKGDLEDVSDPTEPGGLGEDTNSGGGSDESGNTGTNENPKGDLEDVSDPTEPGGLGEGTNTNPKGDLDDVTDPNRFGFETFEGWFGTQWIAPQEIVDSEKLKSNLDYLFEAKAQKPTNCDGEDQYLGWNNGQWTCVTAGTTTCLFNGTTLVEGQDVTAFQASNVTFGSTCVSETRTCNSGVLSGSFQADSCVIADPRSCVLADGSVLEHNESQTRYETSVVASDEVCQSETRTCIDGTVSGSYLAESCYVESVDNCAFGGSVVEDGDSVIAYQSETVEFGSTCQSEMRECSDGTLSGDYTSPSCEVSRPDPVTFRQSDFVVSNSRPMCRNIWTGETKTRDAEGECPGWVWVKFTQEFFHLENNPAVRYNGRTAGAGFYTQAGYAHNGLASDPTTLRLLCNLKGYNHLVGQAPRNRSGFRTLTSPGDNKLVYLYSTSVGPVAHVPPSVTINQTFNGQNGYVVCSDNPAPANIRGDIDDTGIGVDRDPSDNIIPQRR